MKHSCPIAAVPVFKAYLQVPKEFGEQIYSTAEIFSSCHRLTCQRSISSQQGVIFHWFSKLMHFRNLFAAWDSKNKNQWEGSLQYLNGWTGRSTWWNLFRNHGITVNKMSSEQTVRDSWYESGIYPTLHPLIRKSPNHWLPEGETAYKGKDHTWQK